MSSAFSVTRSVNPPRAVYLDFPLGHTTGKPNARELQRAILFDALSAFETMHEPGQVEMLSYEWAQDDAWKDSVMNPSQADQNSGASGYEDNRVERYDTPQYQYEHDHELAEAAIEKGSCETCVWLKH